MISTPQFIEKLRSLGVFLFTGVPDSLLKNFSGYLMQEAREGEHLIAANEGNAIGLAMGHYLATGVPAVVYMQNSGLGNVINPTTSLADPEVYGIPMLFVIGWRGEPGVKDEPQHIKQGKVTLSQLEILDIPYRVVDETSDIDAVLDEIWPLILKKSGPAALVVRKNSLSDVGYKSIKEPFNWPTSQAPLYREAAINAILDSLDRKAVIIATTGKTGRELFELREKRKENQQDFLMVGGMGHASSIALGIALQKKDRSVVCLDGDGAMLMHMGVLTIVGNVSCPNFIHILFNNQSHDSVGGQPTVAGNVDFKAISLACDYRSYHQAHSLEDIRNIVPTLSKESGPHFMEIHLWKGSRKDLGRPSVTPAMNKENVMAYLEAL